jgi:hypothetical protein
MSDQPRRQPRVLLLEVEVRTNERTGRPWYAAWFGRGRKDRVVVCMKTTLSLLNRSRRFATIRSSISHNGFGWCPHRVCAQRHNRAVMGSAGGACHSSIES